VVSRPSIDEFGEVFDPLLEIERTALYQNDPAEYSAHLLQQAINEVEDNEGSPVISRYFCRVCHPRYASGDASAMSMINNRRPLPTASPSLAVPVVAKTLEKTEPGLTFKFYNAVE
jgi:hypothetical protein